MRFTGAAATKGQAWSEYHGGEVLSFGGGANRGSADFPEITIARFAFRRAGVHFLRGRDRSLSPAVPEEIRAAASAR